MKKIVISGYYGFANAGDEAMLAAIIKALRAEGAASGKNSDGFSAPALTVISGNPKVTAAKYGVASIHRFNPWEIFRSLSRCDLLLSGGGSLLQDVTSKRSLLYYLSVLALALLLGKKVMLFAQGIGPIKSGILRKLTKIVCSHADLITVRDRDSLYELRHIGIPPEKVQLTADAVLTLPRESTERGRALLDACGVARGRMLIAISVRKWQEDDRYLLEIAKAADLLSREYDAQVVILPLQYPMDLPACERLEHYMVHKEACVVLKADCDTEEFLSLIGNFDLLIGMRLHALIFAAIMERPFVAISYDPKVDGFVKDIDGVSAGNVENLQAAALAAAAEAALAPGRYGRGMLDKLRAAALLNARRAYELLERGDGRKC